jgi:UDP-3-O-[3-hydroxymyristoyl] N-acetylglucosamine deacetylase
MQKERILIVEDETNIAASLKNILSDEGYEVDTTGDGLDALEKIQSDPPDLLILDIWLPGMDGIEVLKSVKTFHPEIEVLIISGHGTIDTAVQATKLGAFDFIEKPFSLEHITQSVEAALHLKKQATVAGDLFGNTSLPLGFDAMIEIREQAKQLSKQSAPVLVLGEPGTGKEFIAQIIHQQSQESRLPFIKLNCKIRKAENIESILFGSSSDNVTADKASDAKGNSTKKVVFLSNIDALSEGIQERLASADTKTLATRIYAASSKNLDELANEGRFNKTLLERFKESSIYVPPLRDYATNIPSMVNEFLAAYAQKMGVHVPQIDEKVFSTLCNYDWPGNVKELRSILDRIIIASTSRETIVLRDLPPEIRQSTRVWDAKIFKDSDEESSNEPEWEKQFIIHQLRNNGWDSEKTRKSLKAGKKKFAEKLREHGIRLPVPSQKQPTGQLLQRTLKRSMVLCGSGLHSGIKTGLILQPLPPNSGIIFGDISSGQTIPAHLQNVQSTDYSTCLKRGRFSVATIEHIMASLHMYRISNLLIKIGDEAPVMDGSAKDFCSLIEDGEFEEQDALNEEIIIDKTYSFGSKESGGPFISIEPADGFIVSYHMDYPEPIGIQDYSFVFSGHDNFKKEIAPARTFGFMEDVAQLTKMGFASGGKLDNFILLGDKKVLNTELRYPDEFVRHKILDIIGDFYLLGKPIRGHIHAYKSGHTQNVGLLKTFVESQKQASLQAS